MTFAAVRILGNELPPRDLPGSRVKTLRFILENEPFLPECDKFWVLNQIHDKRLREQLENALKEHSQRYCHLDFCPKNYRKAGTFDEKARHAININKARNCAAEIGKSCDFTAVMDGDSFFTAETWQQTVVEIKADQATFDRLYYGIPAVRLTDHIPENYLSLPKVEPTIVFRKDATLRFDEAIPFGKNDKVELLRRLGYVREKGETFLVGELCKTVGCLLHISFSDPRIERELKYRMQIRQKSLEELLKRLDLIGL